MDFAIILVAAGASTRMGFPKLWADVCGKPLIAHALAAALRAEPSEMVIVVTKDRLDHIRDMAPSATVVSGGARRRDSVAARALPPPRVSGLPSTTPPALSHRPISSGAALEAAQPTGAAIPWDRVERHIKRIADSRVVGTPLRAEHVAVQTPQVFRREVLARALATQTTT